MEREREKGKGKGRKGEYVACERRKAHPPIIKFTLTSTPRVLQKIVVEWFYNSERVGYLLSVNSYKLVDNIPRVSILPGKIYAE